MNQIDYFKTDKWHPVEHHPTRYQRYCWEYMKEGILNPIRRYVGMPVRISNVIRLASDYDRLLAAGYMPSQTSDHYAGMPITMPNGIIFAESTFAADFTFNGDMKGLCRDIYRQANDEIFPKIDGLDTDAIGQLIYEGQIYKGKPIYWIHIGLAEHIIYSSGYAKYLVAARNKLRWLEFWNGTMQTTRFE